MALLEVCRLWDRLANLSLNPTSREELETTLNDLVKALRDLSTLKDNNTMIPLSLLEAVEQGRHPEAWMRDELARLLQSHSLALGRRDAFARHLALLSEPQETIAID